MSYERRVTRLPGYDCRTKCEHKVKGDHGICAEMWFFSVISANGAVNLRVSSGQYPATAFQDRSKPSRGWDLSLHSRYPVSVEAVQWASRGSECELLGNCYDAGGGLRIAEELWATHGDPNLAPEAQPEAFWLALEKECAELGVRIEKERTDTKLAQCPSCTGKGVVERGEPPGRCQLAQINLAYDSEGVTLHHNNGAAWDLTIDDARVLHEWLGRYLASVKPQQQP
jgi:hypothetical protein